MSPCWYAHFSVISSFTQSGSKALTPKAWISVIVTPDDEPWGVERSPRQRHTPSEGGEGAAKMGHNGGHLTVLLTHTLSLQVLVPVKLGKAGTQNGRQYQMNMYVMFQFTRCACNTCIHKHSYNDNHICNVNTHKVQILGSEEHCRVVPAWCTLYKQRP